MKDKDGIEKARILVIEDDSQLQQVLSSTLLMAGYDIRITADGFKGYEVFQSFKPDLIITDVVIPGRSGLELAAKIRQDNPEIKVVYVSGFFGVKGFSGTKSLKEELGDDMSKYGYRSLPKPFEIGEMLELISGYLSE